MLKRSWNLETIGDFRTKLLGWYRRHRRELPWRADPTPYRIWISEVMLQQTQTKTVLGYYDRFLERFPDVESLAAAAQPELLNAWAGLGYYRRARNLQKAAIEIVKKHASFPKDFPAILALPGIGRYTAGAICSIAFNEPYPAVDGNVRRVLTRLTAIRGQVPEGYFWDLVSGWIPQRSPAEFNQAMMELGALVCVPRRPECRRCPVRAFCEAKRIGIERSIPGVRLKPASKRLRLVVLVLEQKQRILLSRTSPGSLIPGDWGLPWQLVPDEESAEETASSLCKTIFRGTIRLKLCATVRHTISNHQITGFGFYGKAEPGEAKARTDNRFRWEKRDSLGNYLTSSIFRKVLDKQK
jgi:A/G-specific adenine glycosylase